MDAVAFFANIATLVAVTFTAIALFLAARQLLIGRRAASAGAFVALNESLLGKVVVPQSRLISP
jgi:hypothetical protein